ncbi:MAG: hypothetical protein QM831_14965 [Kofleriaceae bacterium]
MDEAELKKHIAAMTDDPASVVPLADWLQQQQHPWGELIALQSRGMTAEANVILDEIKFELCPPLEQYGTTATWKDGFIARAQIASDDNWDHLLTAVKTFLSLPAAARVDEIVFAPIVQHFRTWRDWDSSRAHIVEPWAGLAALASLIAARITRVGFGPWPAIASGGYTRMPAYSEISEAFPKLTSLELVGFAPAAPGVLALPELRSLAVRFAVATDNDLQALAKLDCPQLERLEIGTGGSVSACVDEVYDPEEWNEEDEDALRYPSTFSAEDLERMIAWGNPVTPEIKPPGFTRLLEGSYPKLQHLAIVSSAMSARMIEPVFESALLGQLRTLQLSCGMFDDKDIAAITTYKAKLAHLERVDLSGNKFSETGKARLLDAIPNAVFGDHDTNALSFFFRYVATVE